MQLTFVLELLKPTKRKQNVFLENIAEVVKNRQAIAERLKAGETKLSSADFKEHDLPSAVKNQNIREVKALYKRFLKSDSDKENITFKKNQPICYNNQNYKIDGHIISMPLYTTRCRRFIEYKAKLAGIKVEYINPEHTSQRCSKCGRIKKTNRKGNLYSCNCGNHIHSDLNAGRNIAHLGQQSA